MARPTHKPASTAACVMAVVAMVVVVVVSDGPRPFTKTLRLTQPYTTGREVSILQALLNRDDAVSPAVAVDGAFGEGVDAAVKQFQAAHGLGEDGIVGFDTAALLLQLHAADGFVDDHSDVSPYLYKIWVPVYRNRSVETTGSLFDAEGNVLHTFRARTHGQMVSSKEPIDEFSTNGHTPTGLFECDLNSPMSDPVSYGPYPINRATNGLKGNAGFLVPELRNGILVHTGEWKNWDTSQPMPNSHGCIHLWPEDVDQIWQILTKQLGVVIRDNPGGQTPYPYEPQGLLAVELQED